MRMRWKTKSSISARGWIVLLARLNYLSRRIRRLKYSYKNRILGKGRLIWRFRIRRGIYRRSSRNCISFSWVNLSGIGKRTICLVWFNRLRRRSTAIRNYVPQLGYNSRIANIVLNSTWKNLSTSIRAIPNELFKVHFYFIFCWSLNYFVYL
jgi:hypothetical protein